MSNNMDKIEALRAKIILGIISEFPETRKAVIKDLFDNYQTEILDDVVNLYNAYR